MEENKITAITKERTDVLREAYKDTLEILDAYDHQTLIRPEGTYYDGNETIEEVAVNMLYDMIKNPVWYDCNKQMAAIKFLLFLEILLIGGKIMVFRCPNATIFSIYFSVVVHPVVVEDVFSEFRKWTFSVDQFLNICNSSDISCITTTRHVACYFPLRLNEEDEILYHGLDNI